MTNQYLPCTFSHAPSSIYALSPLSQHSLSQACVTALSPPLNKDDVIPKLGLHQLGHLPNVQLEGRLRKIAHNILPAHTGRRSVLSPAVPLHAAAESLTLYPNSKKERGACLLFHPRSPPE